MSSGAGVFNATGDGGENMIHNYVDTEGSATDSAINLRTASRD